MADRKLLRLSVVLLLTGALVSTVEGVLQPRQANPNNHIAKFAEIANSVDWTAIQLLEFIGVAIFLAGLLVLFFSFNVTEGTPRWLGFFGAISAGATLVLASIQDAVIGVALKQAVNAWVIAPAAEQATRFASAEAIIWLDWGVASYQAFMYGLALLLLALVIVWTARVPRPIGYLMGLDGITYLVQGWILGTAGYPASLIIPKDLDIVLRLALIVWLLIVAWRKKGSVQTAPI